MMEHLLHGQRVYGVDVFQCYQLSAGILDSPLSLRSSSVCL